MKFVVNTAALQERRSDPVPFRLQQISYVKGLFDFRKRRACRVHHILEFAFGKAFQLGEICLVPVGGNYVEIPRLPLCGNRFGAGLFASRLVDGFHAEPRKVLYKALRLVFSRLSRILRYSDLYAFVLSPVSFGGMP